MAPEIGSVGARANRPSPNGEHATTVKVIIPWRPGCHYREQNLETVLDWWEKTHPTWTVHLGVWPTDLGPWSKGYALNRALQVAPETNITVVSDADVIAPGIRQAVDALSTGHYEWAVPHRTVYRLGPEVSELVATGRLVLPPTVVNIRDYRGLVHDAYTGSPGGGTVALTSTTLARVPIDPRFKGYGHEDHSWSKALHMLAKAPHQVTSPLWHLWHPPQKRLASGNTVSRGIGSIPSLSLWTRYRSATTPSTMNQLIKEAREALIDHD